MSSEAESPAMDYETMFFENRVVFACAFSIIMWEQAMSFRDEYNIVWKSRNTWTLAKILFVLNRYCAILGLIMYIVWFTAVPAETCIHIHFLPTVFCIIALIVGDLILALRVFALWEKNLYVGISLFGMNAAIIGFNAWMSHQSTGVPFSGGPCMSLTGERMQRYDYLANILCVIFEVVALALVVIRVYRYRKGGARGGLIDSILNDSVQYFLMVFSVKLLNALNFILNEKSPALFAPIAVAVCSIMCSRVFFGLVNQSHAPSTLNSSTGWHSSIVGPGKITNDSASGNHHSVQLNDLKEDTDLELKTVGLDIERR